LFKEKPMFKRILFAMSLLLILPMQGMAEESGANATGAKEIGPKEAVEITVKGVIDVLKARKDQTTLSEQDRAAIREAVSVYFDFNEMGKRALAAPWKELSAAQQTEFVALFRQLLELTYGNRLANFRNQRVEYGEVYIKGRIAIVDSEVVDADKTTPVRYKLVSKEVGWRVYDIQVEGISMVSTFRTDFTTAFYKDGAEGFLAGLKERVTGMQDQDKG